MNDAYFVSAITAKKIPRNEYCNHVSAGGDLKAQTRRKNVTFAVKAPRKRKPTSIRVPSTSKPSPITDVISSELPTETFGQRQIVELSDGKADQELDVTKMLKTHTKLRDDTSNTEPFTDQAFLLGNHASVDESTNTPLQKHLVGEADKNTLTNPREVSQLSDQQPPNEISNTEKKNESRSSADDMRLLKIRKLVDEVLGLQIVQPKRADREERARRTLGSTKSANQRLLTTDILVEGLGVKLTADLGTAVSCAFDVDPKHLDLTHAALLKCFQLLAMLPQVKKSGAIKRATKSVLARINEINGSSR